jgi:uncharacterized repeat protein (TIGR01451 family)
MTRIVCGLLAVLALGLVGAGPAAAKVKEDMTIWGWGVRQPVYKGETTQLKFVVKNNGPDTATGVWVQTDVPAGLHVLGTKLYGGRSCSVQGTFVKCQMGDFVDQQEGTVLVDVRADDAGTWITEADVYSTDGRDTSPGNYQVRATIMVKSRVSGGGSGGSGGSGGATGSTTTASLAARMRARFEKLQRVIRDGGIRVTMRVPRPGALDVGARVHVGNRTIALASVYGRRAGTHRAYSFWLGASPAVKAQLRQALQRHTRLFARIWVHYKGETILYDLQVRR